MIESRMRPLPNGRSRNHRLRRSVAPARFATVVLHLPEADATAAPRAWIRDMRLWALLLLVIAALAAGAWMALREPPAAPAHEEIFVLEELAPAPEIREIPPDPSPPPPEPEAQPQEAPPPQFGMQQEALSEAGEMAVATGNTLMTQADSVVKAPVAALPATPEFFDQPPRILSAPEIEYPARALEFGLQGTSVIRIVIDTEGKVTRVSVEKSGGKDFDQSALRSARGTRFQPYTKGGKPVLAEFIRPYKFELEEPFFLSPTSQENP
jgi:protein TonB